MVRKPTALKLKVRPDLSTKPKAHLNDRSPRANGRKKIAWVKDEHTQPFDFVGLTPHANAFKNIVTAADRIECDFHPHAGQTEYEYTITIEFNGQELDTDEDGDPDSGRAVIRN